MSMVPYVCFSEMLQVNGRSLRSWQIQSVTLFLPKLEAVCGSRWEGLSHGRRPPGGRSRTVAG
eukprot:scaffold42026_cov102-Phaeocystis_antarctica.AAC.1